MPLNEIYFDQSIRDYALKLTKDVHEAEELVSQCYIKCIGIKQVNKRYFARVLKNTFLDNQKKIRAKPIDYIQDIADEQDNTKHQVEQVLSQMHFYSRDLLECIMEGTKTTTLHRITSIPYSTLKTDINNAKKKFKNLYSNIKIGIILPGIKDNPQISGLNAVKYHRLLMPLAHLIQKYQIQWKVLYNYLDDTWMQEVDDLTHVIYSRELSSINRRQDELCANFLREKGIKIIHDQDDYWYLPESHMLYKYYRDARVSEQQIGCMKRADMVWTTTPQLASKIKEFNKNVHIVKNALWDKQFINNSTSLDFDTFYYFGGSTHDKDLHQIRGLMDDYRFKIMIASSKEGEKGWNRRVRKWFPNADKLPAHHISEYAKSYITAGIFVVPLIENEFNRCKSELKLIEAGHFAKPCIVSNVEPFTNLATHKNSIKVKNRTEDWKKALKKIHGDHQLQYDLGKQLQADVNENYNMDKQNEIRLQTL